MEHVSNFFGKDIDLKRSNWNRTRSNSNSRVVSSCQCQLPLQRKGSKAWKWRSWNWKRMWNQLIFCCQLSLQSKNYSTPLHSAGFGRIDRAEWEAQQVPTCSKNKNRHSKLLLEQEQSSSNFQAEPPLEMEWMDKRIKRQFQKDETSQTYLLSLQFQKKVPRDSLEGSLSSRQDQNRWVPKRLSSVISKANHFAFHIGTQSFISKSKEKT